MKATVALDIFDIGVLGVVWILGFSDHWALGTFT